MKKINTLAELRNEKLILQLDAERNLDLIKKDIELIKNEFKPLQLFNKASETIVPESLRRSNLINAPINFIAKALFKEKGDVVNSGSDSGTGNHVRNIALGVIESAATYLLTRYIRNKF